MGRGVVMHYRTYPWKWRSNILVGVGLIVFLWLLGWGTLLNKYILEKILDIICLELNVFRPLCVSII